VCDASHCHDDYFRDATISVTQVLSATQSRGPEWRAEAELLKEAFEFDAQLSQQVQQKDDQIRCAGALGCAPVGRCWRTGV